MTREETLDLINERPKSEHVCSECGRPLDGQADDMDLCWTCDREEDDSD